jgi:hypothetical protein
MQTNLSSFEEQIKKLKAKLTLESAVHAKLRRKIAKLEAPPDKLAVSEDN